MVRIPLVLLTLVLCLPAAAANLTVLPEQRISIPSAEPTRNEQLSPAIASRGRDALAVWTDSRSGSERTFATRIQADGKVVDPFGILVNATASENPDVAWNGTDYIVIASQRVQDPYAFRPLHSSRVAPDGSVAPRVLLGDIEGARLAGNGREVALGGTIYGLGPAFALLDPQGRIRVRTTIGPGTTRVYPVADGTDWFAFADARDCDTCPLTVKLHTFDRDARITNSVAVMDRPTQWHRASVIAAEGRFFLTWATLEVVDGVNFRHTVWYTVVDREGRRLVLPTILEHTSSSFANTTMRWGGDGLDRPAAVWDGEQFVVLWKWFDGAGETALRSSRVSLDGARLDSAPMTSWTLKTNHLVNGWTSPVAVKTDSHLLVQWGAVFPLESPYRRVALTQRAVASAAEFAQPGPAVEITRAASSQFTVGLAPGPDGLFVTWHEAGASARLHARVFPYDGMPSAPVRVSLESSAPGRGAYGTASTWGGGVFLVVWREDQLRSNGQPIVGRILMRRYDSAGGALDAEPVELASEGYRASYLPGMELGVAFDGARFLVTWAGVNDNTIHAKRVTPAGEIVDRLPLKLSNTPDFAPGAPKPVWTGSEYVIIWYEDPVPSSNGGAPLPILSHYARVTRLSPDGTVLDASFPRIITTPPGFDLFRSMFEVVSNGNELFVTWAYTFHNETPRRNCGYGQRFTLKGEPIDREPIEMHCQDGSFNSAPRPIWTGEEWLLVYSLATENGGIAMIPLRDGRPQGLVTKIVDSGGGPRIVRTPAGIFLGYGRADAAFGNVSGVFLRRLGQARSRAVRH